MRIFIIIIKSFAQRKLYFNKNKMFDHDNQFKISQFDEILFILCFVAHISYENLLTYELLNIFEIKRLKLQKFNIINDNMYC